MSGDSSPAPESWISSFCSLLGHEYFAEVSEDFIEDDFNLTGLQALVPMYKEALEMILDVEPDEEEDEDDEAEEEEDEDEIEERLGGGGGAGGYRRATTGAGVDRRHMRMGSDLSVIESSAEMLYGLIHQRYITSRPGIQQMAEKYELQHFGVCPRVFCNGCRVLPVGSTDTPGQDTVKLFCPSCLDIYTPPNSRFQTVDGAFFGTTFGCLFFMTFPELDVGARAEGLLGEPASAFNPNHADKSRSSSLSSGLPISSSSETTQHRPQPTVLNGIQASNLAPGLGQAKIYEPRIYGFRVAERARSGPRMQWLRSKPADLNELDEARRFHEAHADEVMGNSDDEDEDEIAGAARRAAALARRKKAPIRKRRQVGSGRVGAGGGGAGGGGSPMDITNGLGNGV
ncbi:MAG: casein kinase 2 regulatory subunit [Peltula sp. TS41687]|nr:MAG: casein kinase 2 regulatory subunit [Peltula sp. TS41687]